jgi:hypothetical protein
MLCKHFETSKGCAFKDKCQFAHGLADLRSSSGSVRYIYNQLFQTTHTTHTQLYQQKQQIDPTKKGPNPQNYKIVKCKYWEKEGTCRYGTLCTFAHGDTEIRTKTDNSMLTQPQMGYYDQNVQIPNSDMNQLQGMQNMPGMVDPMFSAFNMMNPYAMGFDPNMMMNPNLLMGFNQGAYDPNLMMNPMNQNYPGGFSNMPGGNFQNPSGNNTKNGTNV